jgi:hypothetical protein
LGVDPERVKLIEYNLLANQDVEFVIGRDEIENTRVYIAGSIADMQSLLVDVGENVPKDEEAFSKVEDDRDRAGCNFRKVCDWIFLNIILSLFSLLHSLTNQDQ